MLWWFLCAEGLSIFLHILSGLSIYLRPSRTENWRKGHADIFSPFACFYIYSVLSRSSIFIFYLCVVAWALYMLVSHRYPLVSTDILLSTWYESVFVWWDPAAAPLTWCNNDYGMAKLSASHILFGWKPTKTCCGFSPLFLFISQ